MESLSRTALQKINSTENGKKHDQTQTVLCEVNSIFSVKKTIELAKQWSVDHLFFSFTHLESAVKSRQIIVVESRSSIRPSAIASGPQASTP